MVYRHVICCRQVAALVLLGYKEGRCKGSPSPAHHRLVSLTHRLVIDDKSCENCRGLYSIIIGLGYGMAKISIFISHRDSRDAGRYVVQTAQGQSISTVLHE